MKNKIKATSLALVTGIVPSIPHTALAIEKKEIVNSELTSETVDIEWNKEFIENGYESFESIVQTSDGGFVVVGEADMKSEEGGSRGDGVIVKYDKNGEQEWYNKLVGDDTDLFNNVIEANDGGFYVIGKSYSSDLGFENAQNYSHAIIVKYDNAGTQEWIHATNDNGKQINYTDIIQTKEGRLAVVGDKVIGGKRTGFFMGISDSDGKEIFVEEVAIDNYTTRINDIIYDGNDFVLVGKAISDVDSKEVPFVSKVNINGGKVWTYLLEEDKDEKINILNGELVSVVQSENGDLIAVGCTVNDNGNKDSLILKLNKLGERTWYDVNRDETSDSYNSVMINSKNEIWVVGERIPEKDANLLTDLNITVSRYIPGEDMNGASTVYLGSLINNVKASKSIITSDDKIIVAGKSYKKVEGLNTKCDVTKATLPDECIQADALIMQLSLKEVEVPPEEDKNNPCEINEKPVIKADDVTVYEGEEFKPFLNVTATDKENGDLTEAIKITFNNVDINKVGEYKVIYTVTDECGVSIEKERKVTVKAKVVETPTNTEKPQTGDLGLVYAGLATLSTVGLIGINKKKED